VVPELHVPSAPPDDRALTSLQAGVAIALFLLCTACTAGLLWRFDDLGRAALAGVAACLVAGLWAIGAVLDGRLTPLTSGTIGAMSATAALLLMRID
jgi:hypothetical protein